MPLRTLIERGSQLLMPMMGEELELLLPDGQLTLRTGYSPAGSRFTPQATQATPRVPEGAARVIECFTRRFHLTYISSASLECLRMRRACLVRHYSIPCQEQTERATRAAFLASAG